MIVGPLVVALGAVLLAFGGTQIRYAVDFLPGITLVGIGMALVIAPLTKSALAVAPELSGAASGVNNAAARIAALLAVAVLGAVILSAFTSRLTEAMPTSGLSDEKQQEIMAQSGRLAGIEIPGTFDDAARDTARRAIAETFVYGFRLVIAASAALAFCSGLISFVTIRNPRKDS